MNFNQNKYYALMIFLLMLLVLPLNKVYSQKQAQLENELLQQFNTYEFNNGGDNSVTLPDNYFVEDRELIDSKRAEYESQEHQNYLQIYMDGDNNNVTAAQENGVGNIMDIGIDGSNNTGAYSQQGNKNYIYDRFDGYGIEHEINQFGNDLGIYNEGMQALPMKITQQGQGMKLKITGPPN